MSASVDPDTPARAETDEPEVLSAVEHGVGSLTLNRPRAMNALTQEMIDLLLAALTTWADDEAVRVVVLTGAGDRGLCAGGDLSALYRDAHAGDGSVGRRFWTTEYRLDALIADYPKPVVAVMDGVVLGGGIGVSAHASHRIVTETSSMGMPEVGIGFTPDVGGTRLLARAPGELGTHLALTGTPMRAGDALVAGFADHYVERAAVPALLHALATERVDGAIASVASAPPDSALAAERSWIDPCYAGDDLAAILRRLETSDVEAAHEAARTIRAKSPTSCALALRALRQAATADSLAETLRTDYRLAVRLHAGHDFIEGIRAQIIDKDRSPHWRPDRIEDLNPAEIDRHFAPLDDDLTLTDPAGHRSQEDA